MFTPSAAAHGMRATAAKATAALRALAVLPVHYAVARRGSQQCGRAVSVRVHCRGAGAGERSAALRAELAAPRPAKAGIAEAPAAKAAAFKGVNPAAVAGLAGKTCPAQPEAAEGGELSPESRQQATRSMPPLRAQYAHPLLLLDAGSPVAKYICHALF